MAHSSTSSTPPTDTSSMNTSVTGEFSASERHYPHTTIPGFCGLGSRSNRLIDPYPC
jgi:hypothetical protein